MKPYASHILLSSVIACALAGSAMCAQTQTPLAPGPTPAPAAFSAKVSTTIIQLNYDPDGDVNGFIAANGSLVHVPASAVTEFGQALRASTPVTYSGYVHTGITGRSVVDVQALTLNGRTVVVERAGTGPRPPAPPHAGPPPPAPPAGPAPAGTPPPPPPPDAPAAPAPPRL